MEVLFTLLAERYERRHILISSNLVFSQWDLIYKGPVTTMAAVACAGGARMAVHGLERSQHRGLR
jgi:DNA replication protein DnaC